MQPAERMNDFMLALDAATAGLQARLWTAMPGIVEAYNAEDQTATIQGAIKPQIMNPDGTWKSVTLPLFGKVPVVWPGGGGLVLTFPLAKGDEGLVVFAKNCIDAWWQNGGVQAQIEVRQHDLSDAIFVPGLRSVPRKLDPAPSPNRAQLRTEDGATFIDIDPGEAGAGIVRVTALGGIILEGPLTINGVPVTQPGAGVLRFGAALESTDSITAKVGPNSVTLDTHVHPGNNAPPTPGS